MAVNPMKIRQQWLLLLPPAGRIKLLVLQRVFLTTQRPR